MSILELVPSTDPILDEVLPRFDFDNPPINPDQLAVDLAETMIANKGLGLSANQVGLRHRAFVITGSPIIALFNPRIVDTTPEEINMEEGCLSFPGLYFKVKRPAAIKIRYQRPNGETVTEQFHGLTARIVQHEIDHLDGIKYTSRGNRIHVDAAKKKVRNKFR